MIYTSRCKLCKEVISANGRYKASDMEESHLRTKHFKAYKINTRAFEKLWRKSKQLDKQMENLRLFTDLED